jgi:hypothetical protein
LPNRFSGFPKAVETARFVELQESVTSLKRGVNEIERDYARSQFSFVSG